MPATTNISGMVSDYSIDVRKADGSLRYRESSVMFPELPPIPEQPNCYSAECIKAYKQEVDLWAEECKKLADFYRLLHEYHSARCDYCMTHKGEKIEAKYITGEPSPQTIEEAKIEIRKLRR
uniref:Uncharacterized protein n=1 Tax=viral metagenome TaxID=1070528 RepID=A0A6M3IZY6_9ZZZZ